MGRGRDLCEQGYQVDAALILSQWFNQQHTQGSDPSGSADNENGTDFPGIRRQ